MTSPDDPFIITTSATLAAKTAIGTHAFRILAALSAGTAVTCGHIEPGEAPVLADVAVNYVSCAELDCIRGRRVLPLADRTCDLCGTASPCGWANTKIGRLALLLAVCDACEMAEVIGTDDFA